MSTNDSDVKWGSVNELPFYWIETKAIRETNETILFLHGFPDDARTWSHQIDHFKDNFNILAPYIWGTYKEYRYKATHYSLKFLTDSYKEFLEQQNIDPSNLTIVAHDLGGPLACTLARELNPKNIILINCLSLNQFISRFKDIEQWLRSSYMFLFQNPLLNKKVLGPFSKTLLNKAYDIGGVEQDDPMRENKAEVLSGIEQYRRYLREIPEAVFKSQPALEVSSHILWGKNDPFLKVPTNQELCEFYNRFEFHTFNGSHWLHRTNIEEINSYIEGVLNG